MQNKPLVSILVLNYNGIAHLPVCLASLTKQTYSNYELILVDNNSTDDSLKYVENNFPKIKIAQSNQNLGTAGGFNFGVKYAIGEYLLFLANDLETQANLIEELVDKIQESDNIAICSGKMMKFDRRNTIDYNGFLIDLFAFPNAPGHNQEDHGQGQELVDVAPTGTVLLIKKNVFEEVGGFDDAYFTLGDEIDLWWRVKLLGYRAIINHNALVYHKAAATLSKEKRSRLRFYSEKNTIRTLLKNYSFGYLLFLMPVYGCILIAEMIFYIFTGKFGMFLALIKALSWNASNFYATCKLRGKIQSKRVIPDKKMRGNLLLRSEKLYIFWQVITNKVKF